MPPDHTCMVKNTKTMTKREREYHQRRKRDRFWGKIFNICSDYTLAKLKMQQLVMRKQLIPEQIYQTQQNAINELNQIINQ